MAPDAFPAMHLTAAFSLRLHTAGTDLKSARSEILRAGQPTGKVIDATVLQAAIAWQNCTVLLVTDDIPYEEFLTIHLLDAELNLLDTASIGTMYGTDELTQLTLVGPAEFEFSFLGRRRVELLLKAQWRDPFNWCEPPGVWRAWGFHRHFCVKAVPGNAG